jgi:hypothetical protein
MVGVPERDIDVSMAGKHGSKDMAALRAFGESGNVHFD